MRAAEYTDVRAAEFAECRNLPAGVRLLSRLLPAADRDSIVGDLLEDAQYRDLRGRRLTWWLTAECGAIAARLSVQRARGSFALPPVREVVSGLAIDGRGVLRDGTAGTLLRALVFVASVTTLAFAAEVLVRTLMMAAGL